jgi:hypothetical protein
VLADEQLGGDLAVGHAGRDQGQHLVLASGQAVRQRGRRGRQTQRQAGPGGGCGGEEAFLLSDPGVLEDIRIGSSSAPVSPRGQGRLSAH